MQQPPCVRAVTIPFSDLRERGKDDLGVMIEESLGPHGLGIVSIADVPGYPELRKRLLRLAPRVANLPEEVKKELEDPLRRYNFGWSHGKEQFESGKIAFKDLGKLVVEVGLMLARHCDHYVMNQGAGPYVGESLEKTLVHSKCHKGRLLYYFPQKFSKQKECKSLSSWCGWHTDYASLSGLTCGLFMRKSLEIHCPDSGLCIQSRDNQVVKVTFEDDELAYITGETAEILSRGHLRATPHCVKAPSGENALFVDRSAFALFMQPNWNDEIKLPTEFPYHQELLLPPNETLTFGEYSEMLVNKYYD